MATGGTVTTLGLNIMLDRTFNGSPTRSIISTYKVGSGSTTPAVGDTDLEIPVPLDGTEAVDDCETANWTNSTDTAHGLNSSTYKEGSKSIYIQKNGTTGTTFGVYKTTTSRDFTSKTLFVWLNLTDTTDLVASGTAVTIRFGSDSSNYYYYNIDISDLSNGWNLICFDSAGATGTTGSPVIGSCDYSQIILNTDLAADTVAADRIMMDDLKLASTDDFVGSYESGYPSFDYTNNEIEVQCRVTATQANNFSVSEFGLFNTDGTPLIYSHDVFTAISKTSSEEIIFIAKSRLRTV